MLMSDSHLRWFIRYMFCRKFGFAPRDHQYSYYQLHWTSPNFPVQWVSVSINSHTFVIGFRPIYNYRTLPGFRCACRLPAGADIVEFYEK